jgi:hypothetical protein
MRTVKTILRMSVSAVLTFGVLAPVGCDKGESATKTAQPKATTPTPATKPIIPVAQIADWCPEHGVPESICVQCNKSLAEGFKAKGDWCAEHGVPDSQCFKHHPELKAKFAAAYKEKYGKDVPTGSDEGGKDEKN